MKIIKYIVLETVFLIAMLLCSVVVMKLFDMLFKLEIDNIFIIGFKVGFAAWLGLSVITLIFMQRNNQNKS